MATFEKDFAQHQYGSLQAFFDSVERDGGYKVYESTTNYHAIYYPSDEQAMFSSPGVKSPRLVWEKQ